MADVKMLDPVTGEITGRDFTDEEKAAYERGRLARELREPLLAIRRLERTITPRRIREAILGVEEEKDWLKSREAEIAVLRKKIPK